MDNLEASDRRRNFISDIVEVCNKHRVMVDPDGSEYENVDAENVSFFETHEFDGVQFFVSLSDLEDAIRRAVWPVVHGVE